MQIKFKIAAPVVPAKPVTVPLTVKPVVSPEKTKVKPRTSKDLAEISEADLEKMQQEMIALQSKLKNKKGVNYDIDIDEKITKGDTTWANPFIQWAEKNKYKCNREDVSPMRVDLYKDDLYSWRICIIRTLGTNYSVGFYFNINGGGYPKSLEFHMIPSANSLQAIDYCMKALALFGDKE